MQLAEDEEKFATHAGSNCSHSKRKLLDILRSTWENGKRQFGSAHIQAINPNVNCQNREESEKKIEKMVLGRLPRIVPVRNLLMGNIIRNNLIEVRRQKTHFRSGALKPIPDTMPFGLLGVVGAVIPGLFIGAAISKSIANFLEENDLFVPSDDDDDED